MGTIGTGTSPHRTGPADHPKTILAAKDQIIGNVEIAGPGIFSPNSKAHALKSTILHCQTNSTHHFFLTGKNSHVGVAKGEPIKNVIARCHHIEQAMIAITIENHLAIASRFNGDGLFHGSLQRQRQGAVERCHHRVNVVIPFWFVQPGMHQQRIACLRTPFPNYAPITKSGTVVSLQDASKTGFNARARIVRRINMQSATALIGHRFTPRFHFHKLGCLA